MFWFISTGLLHAGDIRRGVLETFRDVLHHFVRRKPVPHLLFAAMGHRSLHQDRWVAELEQIISSIRQWPGKTCATCSLSTSHHVTSCHTHTHEESDWCCLCQFCSSHGSHCSFVVTALCQSLCQCIHLCDMAVPQACAAPTALDKCYSCTLYVDCFIREHRK